MSYTYIYKVPRLFAILIIVILNVCFLASCGRDSDKKTDSGQSKDLSDDVKNSNQANEDENLLPFEEGVIHYKYTGSYEGTQIIYFKDNGRIFRVEEDYINKISPVGDKVKQVYISSPERIVYYNLETREGYELMKDDPERLKDNLLRAITEVGLDSAMTGQGYRKSGEEEISGKQCQIYESKEGESKFCFWNNINIKTDMTLGDKFKYTLEAVKIEDNKKVDDNKFEIPKEVKIMPYKEYSKKMFKF